MEKRDIDVLVLSDLHLGTFGCHAQEIVTYLKSVAPKVLVLNGDIIDIWQFKKHYFPAAHMQVIKQIFSLLSKGTKVYYITGNHDEALRRVRSLDHLHAQFRSQFLHILSKIFTAIAPVDPELAKPAVMAQRLIQQRFGALPFRSVGWGNEDCQNMPKRVDHDEALSPLGLLTRVVAGFRRQSR